MDCCWGQPQSRAHPAPKAQGQNRVALVGIRCRIIDAVYPVKQRFTGLRPHEHPVFFGEDHAVEGEAERREEAQPRSLLVPP